MQRQGGFAARFARGIVIAVCVAALIGCATTSHTQITELRRPDAQQPRIVLMPVDIELLELTTFGRTELKADWTEAGLAHMRTALDEHNAERDLRLLAFDADRLPDGIRSELTQIIKLHGAVGNSILLHQYLPAFQLPTKNGDFDWSLGPQVRELRKAAGADYALFLFVRDSYSSAGRAAMMFGMALLGVAVQGGVQVGFASLVDLETGNVVWFNRLARPTGDLRNAAGAQETTRILLTGLPK